MINWIVAPDCPQLGSTIFVTHLPIQKSSGGRYFTAYSCKSKVVYPMTVEGIQILSTSHPDNTGDGTPHVAVSGYILLDDGGLFFQGLIYAKDCFRTYQEAEASLVDQT